MAIISISVPVVGSPNTTEDPKIANALTTLQTLVNGNLDAANIADSAIGTNEIANSAVTSAKIADGTIAGADVANATLGVAKMGFAPLIIPALAAGSSRSMAFGSGNAIFNDSNNLAASVSHGLGTTPLLVFAQVIPGGNQLFGTGAVQVSNIGASTFAIAIGSGYSGLYPSGANANFNWFAIA